MVIGLKFAGTANQMAFGTLVIIVISIPSHAWFMVWVSLFIQITF
jgi:hypothetical protein